MRHTHPDAAANWDQIPENMAPPALDIFTEGREPQYNSGNDSSSQRGQAASSNPHSRVPSPSLSPSPSPSPLLLPTPGSGTTTGWSFLDDTPTTIPGPPTAMTSGAGTDSTEQAASVSTVPTARGRAAAAAAAHHQQLLLTADNVESHSFGPSSYAYSRTLSRTSYMMTSSSRTSSSSRATSESGDGDDGSGGDGDTYMADVPEFLGVGAWADGEQPGPLPPSAIY